MNNGNAMTPLVNKISMNKVMPITSLVVNMTECTHPSSTTNVTHECKNRVIQKFPLKNTKYKKYSAPS